MRPAAGASCGEQAPAASGYRRQPFGAQKARKGRAEGLGCKVPKATQLRAQHRRARSGRVAPCLKTLAQRHRTPQPGQSQRRARLLKKRVKALQHARTMPSPRSRPRGETSRDDGIAAPVCPHQRRRLMRWPPTPKPKNTSSTLTCGSCKAVYAIDKEILGKGAGAKVQCEVCGNVWFQATARVNTLFDGFELKEYDAEKAQEAIDKQKARAKEAADRPPRKRGAATLFVANLPFRYSDDDVVALFAEVAPITSAQVVMDDDGRSRGYGFVEIEVASDAEKLIGEFHGSDVGGRDLIVRPGKQSGGDGGGRGVGAGGGAGEDVAAGGAVAGRRRRRPTLYRSLAARRGYGVSLYRACIQ